jgi:hypothetical protein
MKFFARLVWETKAGEECRSAVRHFSAKAPIVPRKMKIVLTASVLLPGPTLPISGAACTQVSLRLLKR